MTSLRENRHYATALDTSDPTIEAFAAIASPVRRDILDRLTGGDFPVNELAAGFAMSRPAISQHLRILLAAGLVAEHRQGRTNRYRLVPENLAPVREWIRHYERFWDDHLGRLQSVLQKRAVLPKHSNPSLKGRHEPD